MPPEIDTSTLVTEHPVFLPVDGQDIFALVTCPTGPQRGVGVVIPWGNGSRPSFGENQIRARLARSAAGMGFCAVRFDYAGVGESSGSPSAGSFEQPATAEILACVAELQRRGCDQIVLIGKCFGGRNSVAAAPHVAGLRGVALLSSPLAPETKDEARVRNTTAGDLARTALHPDNWRRMAARRGRYARHAARVLKLEARRLTGRKPGGASADADPANAFLRKFDPLLAAGAHALIVSGTRDPFHKDVMRGMDGGVLAGLQRRYGSRVRVENLEGRVHGLANATTQDTLADIALSWLDDLAPAP